MFIFPPLAHVAPVITVVKLLNSSVAPVVDGVEPPKSTNAGDAPAPPQPDLAVAKVAGLVVLSVPS